MRTAVEDYGLFFAGYVQIMHTIFFRFVLPISVILLTKVPIN